MKKADVKLRHAYLAKVSNRLVPVRISRERGKGWEAINLLTYRTIRVYGAQRLRREVKADELQERFGLDHEAHLSRVCACCK